MLKAYQFRLLSWTFVINYEMNIRVGSYVKTISSGPEMYIKFCLSQHVSFTPKLFIVYSKLRPHQDTIRAHANTTHSTAQRHSLKRPSHGKLKLTNSCWQTQVGMCELHKNSRQTRWQTVFMLFTHTNLSLLTRVCQL